MKARPTKSAYDGRSKDGGASVHNDVPHLLIPVEQPTQG